MPKLARVQQWSERRAAGTAPPRAANVHALHYYAFLSYSHRDQAQARWLHDALEGFRVPPALVGRLTENGIVPKRLAPVFRDRGELPASGELSDRISAALNSSRFLVVLCSPAAAKSHWTNAEIDMFKRHRPDGCVLAAILAGEPFASDIPGREAEECLPPALRERYDRRGRPTGKRAEPLAADFREGGDGRRLGFLKIVAGMLGVGLDELVQRETLRRQRRLAFLTAGSLAGMIITSALAVAAVEARDEAQDQRREAEGLVGFMLGDLRSKLEPLGRLDTLDSVGGRALAYYESQDKESLSDESLAQRSKALTLMGEIANSRGDLDGALRRYREAFASTAELLKRTPDDPQRLYDHAQNVFWVGYIDWQRGRLDPAERAFREYKRLAAQMVALAPGEPRYRLESVYADTNLGAVLYERARFRSAASVYDTALRSVEALVASQPRNRDYQDQLSEALANLSQARESEGRLSEALALRERQIAHIHGLGSADGLDAPLKRKLMTAERAAGRLFAQHQDTQQALEHLRTAAAIGDDLLRTEPENTEWAQFAAFTLLDLGEEELAARSVETAGTHIRAGCAIADRLLAKDQSVVGWRSGLRLNCLEARTRLAVATGAHEEARALADRAVAIARQEAQRSATMDSRFWLAAAQLLSAQAALAAGDPPAAARAFAAAAEAAPGDVEMTPTRLARRSLIAEGLGRKEEATALSQRLAAIGFRHPAYLRDLRMIRTSMTNGRKA